MSDKIKLRRDGGVGTGYVAELPEKNGIAKVRSILLNGNEVEVHGVLEMTVDEYYVADGQIGLQVDPGSRYECSECGAPHHVREQTCNECGSEQAVMTA